jgi:ketosteroid isomerase-like protein
MKKTSLIVLGAAIVLLALRLGLEAFSTPKVPDEQQIRQIFDAGKQAMQKEDVQGVMALVSDDFNSGGYDADRLRYHLSLLFRNSIQLQVFHSPPTIRIEGDRAFAQTEARLRWQDGGWNEQDLGLVEIRLRREDARRWLVIPEKRWRVIAIEGINWQMMPGE